MKKKTNYRGTEPSAADQCCIRPPGYRRRLRSTKWRGWLARPCPTHTHTHKHAQAFSLYYYYFFFFPFRSSHFMAANTPGKQGGYLRVDAEHHDVLPQVPRPGHLHDARLLGLLLESSLQLCRRGHRPRCERGRAYGAQFKTQSSWW